MPECTEGQSAEDTCSLPRDRFSFSSFLRKLRRIIACAQQQSIIIIITIISSTAWPWHLDRCCCLVVPVGMLHLV